MLRDNELRIGWGKAVTIPPTALAATPVPVGLAALAAAKGASFAPPGTAASLPWANAPQEVEKKPHDGSGRPRPPHPFLWHAFHMQARRCLKEVLALDSSIPGWLSTAP